MVSIECVELLELQRKTPSQAVRSLQRNAPSQIFMVHVKRTPGPGWKSKA